jgi:hypothetical protein
MALSKTGWIMNAAAMGKLFASEVAMKPPLKPYKYMELWICKRISMRAMRCQNHLDLRGHI